MDDRGNDENYLSLDELGCVREGPGKLGYVIRGRGVGSRIGGLTTQHLASAARCRI